MVVLPRRRATTRCPGPAAARVARRRRPLRTADQPPVPPGQAPKPGCYRRSTAGRPAQSSGPRRSRSNWTPSFEAHPAPALRVGDESIHSRRPIGRSVGFPLMSHVLAAVAWPYANGPRHIGHVSGFGVPSDVFSRYMRMAGHDVLMVSGTDEHGTPILVQAEKEGSTPRELADRYNRMIVEDLHNLGLSYDLFTRTTTRNHYAVAQELFKTVYDNGYMIKETHAGRDLAVHRADPAGPLHRGHLPDLRLRQRPRRPVRQLRQPARPDRSDQPAQPDQRRDARSSSRPSTSSWTCRRCPRRSATGCVRAPTGAPTCSSSR